MLMRLFRIFVFFALNLTFLIAGGLVNLILLPAGRLRSKAQAIMTMLWSRAICKIFGIRIVKGGRRKRSGGFTVCNHAGYADVFVMGGLRPTVFLSNHEVRRWPLFGWLAALGGVVFVNRNSKRAALKAMRQLERKIESGVTVILFPEGTTSDGKTVRPFKSAFFSIPVRQNIPVRPACIRYPEHIADHVAWHGGAKIAPHFWRFAGLGRIDVSVYFGPLVNPQSDGISSVEARKRLCSLAHESVVAVFNAGRRG
jgi:1-acyl-sn-glycerol-3-phosphate acyltransferase